jgi:hypothetical protein
MMFTVLLHTLYLVGFKKQAVDLAVKWHAMLPIESKKYSAGGAFVAWQKKYPLCEYCTWPIYPNDPHDYCDEQLQAQADEAEALDWYRAEQARAEREEAEWQQFIADEEAKMEQQRLEDEEPDATMADYDDERDDDICDGICGQPAYACTCAETESFRLHQSDPATAGSWWVA